MYKESCKKLLNYFVYEVFSILLVMINVVDLLGVNGRKEFCEDDGNL